MLINGNHWLVLLFLGQSIGECGAKQCYKFFIENKYTTRSRHGYTVLVVISGQGNKGVNKLEFVDLRLLCMFRPAFISKICPVLSPPPPPSVTQRVTWQRRGQNWTTTRCTISLLVTELLCLWEYKVCRGINLKYRTTTQHKSGNSTTEFYPWEGRLKVLFSPYPRLFSPTLP